MDISQCFKRKDNICRCTHCSYEYIISRKEIIKTKKKQHFHKYDETIFARIILFQNEEI